MASGLASGLATVASRTGGTPEIVGDAGFLFERNSMDGLAPHSDALVGDPQMRAGYAQCARGRVQEFTGSVSGSVFESVCKALRLDPPRHYAHLPTEHAL